MNEIEKLYENAGLSNMWVEEYDDNQIWHKSYNKMIESMMKKNDWSRKVAVEVAKKECRKALPPFTAEKQIELIKWLSRFNLCIEQPAYAKGYYFIEIHTGVYSKFLPIFEQALAGVINYLWQDLTSEEKEQIRGILNV